MGLGPATTRATAPRPSQALPGKVLVGRPGLVAGEWGPPPILPPPPHPKKPAPCHRWVGLWFGVKVVF